MLRPILSETATIPKPVADFQSLRHFERELEIQRFDSGDRIADDVALKECLVLLVSGKARLQSLTPTGRPHFLLGVDGSTGALLTVCDSVLARGTVRELVAETAVRAICFPNQSFARLLDVSRSFRALVQDLCGRRCNSLMQNTSQLRLQMQEALPSRQWRNVSSSDAQSRRCHAAFRSFDHADSTNSSVH